MPTVLNWERLTKQAFDAIDRSRAIVAVSSSPLEVHGPHLPLGADILEAEGLLGRTLERLPDRFDDRVVLKLPFVYAAADALPQAGSVGFRVSTTRRVLVDLGNSLAAQGFKTILVSNFHGGPRHFLAIEHACDRVSRRHGITMVSVFSMLLRRLTRGGAELTDVLGDLPGIAREDLVGDTHAGLVETAQLLALHRDLVDAGFTELPRRTLDIWLAERGESTAHSEHDGSGGILGNILRLPKALRFFREESYAGAPATATPELGEAILETLAGHAAEAVTELLDGKVSLDETHSPLWRVAPLFVHPVAEVLADAILGVRKGIG